MAAEPPTKESMTGFDLEAIEHLSEAVRVLDEDIRQLEDRRSGLMDRLCEDRLEELVELFEQRLDREAEAELRSALGYGERKLLWIWARLARLKELRREIVYETMRHVNRNGSNG
ncbi:hypothetical protein K9U39_19575 [Rhodoblastus acidophilus]|uniref:DUF2312 domain-containing protein n=1 Tax=Candidatus Rhodoblastus alkanivorans TaxID=2954117 RepID=A0ABS9ZBM5_9HYPH|nr:hypothetical protein [Candidatus Rhodoblastus alkanivorans]MCI4679124.1 hypothetical protein [Candidatus Rhodoblastus alkanivorans]MCI4684987.1 hypothetical protein [Candidatus Rhodoblastus alkanivorans]MDI4643103.1 hypothetical protein [Rhodoblastus acidophilus]